MEFRFRQNSGHAAAVADHHHLTANKIGRQRRQ
jgi:hypothetical protein